MMCAVQGVETAMEWLLTKTDDESLDDPLDSDEEAEDKVGIAFTSSVWDLHSPAVNILSLKIIIFFYNIFQLFFQLLTVMITRLLICLFPSVADP